MTEARCKHGATEPHGEIGKDWCAGPPRSWYFEAFRGQLEEQMNLDTEMFTRFAEAQEIDASQVPDEVNEPFRTARFSKRVPDAPEVWAVHPHSPLLHIPGDRSARWSNTDPVDNIIAGVRYAMKRYAPAWSTVLQIGADLGEGVEVVAPMTLDHIENFIPMGWTASWGEHWYADPRAPLHVRDWGGEVSFDGEHWTNVRDIGTPIYDALVAEREVVAPLLKMPY